MRRTIILTSLLAALAAAAPAQAGIFPGTPVDGPSADIRALGDVDVARGGTGAIAWVKGAEGADRAFVARFAGGVFQPAERIDLGLNTSSSQPVVGAADEGRLAAAFASGGIVYGSVRPAGQGWSAPTALGAGSDPDVDLSINGTAYVSFTSAGDVRVARLDRRTNSWGTIVQPADLIPARAAGVGGARSRVAIAADGVGVVTWGEGGHVYARKMFGTKLSNAPQDLTPPAFQDRVSLLSELPEVDAEFDSSYAWVVFRQHFTDGGSRILARRQRGTAFDAPVAIDAGGESAGAPRIDLNGRGVGIATTYGAVTGQPMAAQLQRDQFGAGARLFTPFIAAPAAVPTMSDNEHGAVMAVSGSPGQPSSVRVLASEEGKPVADALLSPPQFGAVTPQLGFDAAVDRAGGFIGAWVQSGADGRRIVAGYIDREPGTFRGHTTQSCCKTPLPRLSWAESFNLWGPLRYQVSIDGTLVGETTERELQLDKPLDGPTHRWQVQAVDVRGQTRRSRTRLLRIDDQGPLISTRYKREKRVVTLSVRARDPNRSGHRASGVQRVVVSWGDSTKAGRGRSRVRTKHRYRRTGTFKLRIKATDKAGNERTQTRTVRIK